MLSSQGYSIKTYHPGGDPTLKLAKPPLEVQLSVYRPTLEPFSFNTYPPLEETFISFMMVLVICMYVCMYVTVCTHLFKLTPTTCLLKMSLLKYFYRIFFLFFFFLAGGGVREGSIMSVFPHQFNDFSADTKQSQLTFKADNYRKRHSHLRI